MLACCRETLQSYLREMCPLHVVLFLVISRCTELTERVCTRLVLLCLVHSIFGISTQRHLNNKPTLIITNLNLWKFVIFYARVLNRFEWNLVFKYSQSLKKTRYFWCGKNTHNILRCWVKVCRDRLKPG